MDERSGAGDGDRTRDHKLGKLVLYQLSYARSGSSGLILPAVKGPVKKRPPRPGATLSCRVSFRAERHSGGAAFLTLRNGQG